jgi:hypothetical protein
MDVDATTTGTRTRVIAGVVIASVVAVSLLWWAKWAPYSAKVPGLAAEHRWPGSDILRTGGVRPGDAPSWTAATSFTGAYALAVWRALLAALPLVALSA